MSRPALRTERLGKRYSLAARQPYKALRDSMMELVKLPLRAARRFAGPRRPRPEESFFWALKDVNIEIDVGEVVGLIGRNGAGKTTLLKILTRITEPTEGRAELYGRVASLLEVGTGFHPELTGRENVHLSGAILGMTRSEIARKFDAIVSFSEIEPFIDTPVKHYSSGMAVRLAFAVAAHLEPEILLVDEVLAVGDLSFQQKCLGKMDEVSRAGRTVVLVSHNMGAIKQLCTRAILLDAGRVVASGPADEIVAAYIDANQSGKPELRFDSPDLPGDDYAQLRSIRLCSDAGAPRAQFGSDEAIYVEIDYRLLRHHQRFRVGFSLRSADGTYLFYSSDDDSPEQAGRSRPAGNYVSRCRIPPHLLNVGGFHVVVTADILDERMVFDDLPYLHFTVLTTGGPTARFSEKRRGVLCPLLGWEITQTPLANPEAPRS